LNVVPKFQDRMRRLSTKFDFPLSNGDLSWAMGDSDSMGTIRAATFRQTPTSHAGVGDRQR